MMDEYKWVIDIEGNKREVKKRTFIDADGLEQTIPEWVGNLKGSPGPGGSPKAIRRVKRQRRKHKFIKLFGLGPYAKRSRWNGKPKVGDIYSTKGVADFETARYDGIEDVLVTKVHKKHVEVCLVENVWSTGYWVQTVTDLYIIPEYIKYPTFYHKEGIFICADVVGAVTFDRLQSVAGCDWKHSTSISKDIVPLFIKAKSCPNIEFENEFNIILKEVDDDD